MSASARMTAGPLLLLLSGRATGAGWAAAASGEVSIDKDVAASEPLRVGPCCLDLYRRAGPPRLDTRVVAASPIPNRIEINRRGRQLHRPMTQANLFSELLYATALRCTNFELIIYSIPAFPMNCRRNGMFRWAQGQRRWRRVRESLRRGVSAIFNCSWGKGRSSREKGRERCTHLAQGGCWCAA